MSNQLEKLKNSIKTEYVNKFELNLMRTSGFIPVDRRQNNFYIILNKKNASSRDSISSIVQDTLGDIIPQFIPIESGDFDRIFNDINLAKNENVKESSDISERKVDVDDSKKELSPEEMLVGIGWLTQEQLQEAMNYSVEKKIPLDGAFIEKEFLS